jgi:hypothetical protein
MPRLRWWRCRAAKQQGKNLALAAMLAPGRPPTILIRNRRHSAQPAMPRDTPDPKPQIEE